MRSFKHSRLFVLNNPHTLRIYPQLAKEIGLNESLLLLQLEYWLGVEGEAREDGFIWIRRPVREIQATFTFWSVGTINSIVEALIRKEYVVTADLDQTRGRSGRWFRLNIETIGTLKSVRVCSESEQSMFSKPADPVQDLNNRPYSKKNKDIYTDTPSSLPSGYKQPKRTKTLIPADFEVTDGMRNWAHGVGLTDDRVDNTTERYIRNCRKKEKRLYPEHWAIDWEEWVLNEMNFNGNGHKKEPEPSEHPSFMSPPKPPGYFEEDFRRGAEAFNEKK